jgi:putative ABC transport system permease protein
MRVAAVMKNLPHNTMVPSVDIVTPLSANMHPLYTWIAETWYSIEFHTFLRIKPGANISAIAEKMTNEVQPPEHASYRSFTIQPLRKMRLYTAKGEPGDIKKVRMFFFIAITILLIACINHVNMVTARAIKRTREVGARKIMGAKKVQIFWRLIVEAIALFIMATPLALLIIYMLAPAYAQLTDKPLRIFGSGIWLIMGGSFTGGRGFCGYIPNGNVVIIWSPCGNERGDIRKRKKYYFPESANYATVYMLYSTDYCNN